MLLLCVQYTSATPIPSLAFFRLYFVVFLKHKARNNTFVFLCEHEHRLHIRLIYIYVNKKKSVWETAT